MSKNKPGKLTDYAGLLADVKQRIRHAQTRAMLSVNAELIRLYWDIGRLLDSRQVAEGYGTAVIPRLARDLRNELPEVKGFSERNIGRMIAFFRAYRDPAELLPQPVAKVGKDEVLPQAVAKPSMPDSVLWSVPWGHHSILLEKVKNVGHRLWYMGQTLQYGWSRNVLDVMIKSDAHARHWLPRTGPVATATWTGTKSLTKLTCLGFRSFSDTRGMAMLVLSHSREVHTSSLQKVRRLSLLVLALGGALALSTTKLTATPFVPDDPYFFTGTPEGFPGQWHLDKQTSGAVIDANVRGAWERGLTGQGVTIGIVEDAFEYTHPDLAINYVAEHSWDFVDNDPDPRDSTSPETSTGFYAHAAAVAGVAAARGGNGIGVTGAAPRASVASLALNGMGGRVTERYSTERDMRFADASMYHASGGPNGVQIFSHSGHPNAFTGFFTFPLVENAVRESTAAGAINV